MVLVGLITQPLGVRIPPPQPEKIKPRKGFYFALILYKLFTRISKPL